MEDFGLDGRKIFKWILNASFKRKKLSLKHALFFTQYFPVITQSKLQRNTTNVNKYRNANSNAVREIFLQRQEMYD